MTAQSHVKILFFYTTQFIPLSLFFFFFIWILILLYSTQLTIFMPHAEAKMGEPVVNGEKHYSQFLDVSIHTPRHSSPTPKCRTRAKISPY